MAEYPGTENERRVTPGELKATVGAIFQACGMNEADVRSKIYFAAVCRCFPGKAPGGTDRVHECVTAREVGRPESLLRRMNELELDTTTSPARLILHGDAGRSERDCRQQNRDRGEVRDHSALRHIESCISLLSQSSNDIETM